MYKSLKMFALGTAQHSMALPGNCLFRGELLWASNKLFLVKFKMLREKNMNTTRIIAGGQKHAPFTKGLMAAAVCAALLGTSAQAQFQWAKRIASTTTLPSNEPDLGMSLDSQGNCYMTGWFTGTNDFGGVVLTNATVGGTDIYVAKYNSTGDLQWVQSAGSSTSASLNYGRGAGVDTNGNIYVTGGFLGPANFGGINLPGSQAGYEEFFLAKYDSTGAIQWVRQADRTNGVGYSDGVYGIGLAVDGAGNSYALAFGYAATITFGTTTLTIPGDYGESSFLVKYDDNGNVQWAQVLGGTGETYTTKVAVDTDGNVYVRGTFSANLTIGTSNLVVSAGSTKNMFVAKFANSGALLWVQQPTGGNVDEGGVAVDLAGNVYVSGSLNSKLDFGGISLTVSGTSDAFVAKYNNAGVIQWARQAGGSTYDTYWDAVLDGQGNVYAAGNLSSKAVVTKYSAQGTLQWSYSANSPAANPVGSLASKAAVDLAGNCFLAGLYQGTATFGTTVLPSQGAWNFFLSKVMSPADTNAPVLNIIAPTSGQHWSNAIFTVTGTARDNVAVSNVFYSLNNGGWSNAVSVNNWSNWTATVTLMPGTNPHHGLRLGHQRQCFPDQHQFNLVCGKCAHRFDRRRRWDVERSHQRSIVSAWKKCDADGQACTVLPLTNWR